MRKVLSQLTVMSFIVILLGFIPTVSFADAEEESFFPVVDSLGQYDRDDYSFFSGPLYSDFFGFDREQLVTEVDRDGNGRVTEITQFYPPDPGMGTLHYEYTYDEDGRFTEIHMIIEGSELETVYAYPRTEKRLTFQYGIGEQDKQELIRFDISSPVEITHGEVYYGADGKPLTGTLEYEMYFGDPFTYREEVDFTSEDNRYPMLNGYLIGVMDRKQEVAG